MNSFFKVGSYLEAPNNFLEFKRKSFGCKLNFKKSREVLVGSVVDSHKSSGGM